MKYNKILTLCALLSCAFTITETFGTPMQRALMKGEAKKQGITLTDEQARQAAQESYQGGGKPSAQKIKQAIEDVHAAGGPGAAAAQAAPAGAAHGGAGAGAGAGAAHAIAPLADPYKFRGEIITAPAAPVGNESVWHIKITATKDAGGATVAPAATEIMVLRGEAARAAGLDLAHLNVATKLEFERKSARNRIMAPHVNEHGAGLGGNIGHYQALDRMQIIH